MLGCGTATFTDPEDFRANVPGASINLVLTSRCDFKTHLTWVNVGGLRVVRCEESAPRIAFVALEPRWVFVSFPTRHNPPPIWNGIEMRPGEIVWHGLGDRIHQRTNGPGRWALMSLASRDLADFSQALIYTKLTPSPAGKILRPSSKLVAELLRLHAQACRLVETKPDMIAHREVARAMEHDLLYALVNCLDADEAHHNMNTRQHRADIMARFEEVLASHEDTPRSMPEIAVATGVSERTLRKCCEAFLGMSPGRYARLRSLNLARAALRRAVPATASVGAIAKQYGFTELGRFAVAYRTIFGETPSTTLQNTFSLKAKFA
jgi:AraC-like DNA-binding protein